MFDIKLAMLSSEVPVNNIASFIDKNAVVNDPLLIPHLTDILSAVNNSVANSDILNISNIVKQTKFK